MKKSIVFGLFALALSLFSTVFAGAQNIDLIGPAGSGRFGTSVEALPNGNIVVTDPSYDIPSGAANVGAVYLYHGGSGALINTMIGTTAEDNIGWGGVTVLPNGNYAVKSFNWNNGMITDAGAITLCSGTTGCPATISPANSLVGSTVSDNVGVPIAITVLPNGKFVVITTNWDNGAAQNAGAVTLCDAATGCTGAISPANSLVGSTGEDRVGNSGIAILTNGNYLVRSTLWNNAGAPMAGAVTFCNASTGTTGVVSAANSLVGSTAEDQIGFAYDAGSSVTALANGNYVVRSPFWDNGAVVNAGAATYGSGMTGVSGEVSPANSLVGSDKDDRVSSNGVTPMTNGNYVVCSPRWGRIQDFNDYGAATFGNGTTGISGTISAANSLVGSQPFDAVCGGGVTALTNGNYVIHSPEWENTGVDEGAVTFGNGTTGTTGAVSLMNSLAGDATHNEYNVGSGGITALANGNYVVASPDFSTPGSAGVLVGAVTWCSGTTGCVPGRVKATDSLVGASISDRVGSGGVTALPDGNYVVSSPNWNSGAVEDAGAVTLCVGTAPTVGVVSNINSMTGSATNDLVGAHGVTVLTNGNYVVRSLDWHYNGAANAGAVTFRSAGDFTSLVVSPANSLVGSTAGTYAGRDGIIPLTNGNYVVMSPFWDHGTADTAGAVTFGNGTTGVSGTISVTNSLVGGMSFDLVGSVTALPNGNYVVLSRSWDYGTTPNAGAVTKASGVSGEKGLINSTNSVLGMTPFGGSIMNFIFDAANNQIAVGRPLENIVTLSRMFAPTAANVSIVGRVFNGKTAVSGATVALTDAHGNVRSVKTGSFGYFRFENVQAGQTVLVQASAKGLVFSPQAITLMEDVEDLNFFANS